MTAAARGAFWAAVAVAVVMALVPHPPAVLSEAGDKYQHMLAFATLTALAAAGYPDAALPRLGERLSFLGALIEVVQSIPALHRDCDVMDWVADTVVVIGVLAVVALVRRRWALSGPGSRAALGSPAPPAGTGRGR